MMSVRIDDLQHRQIAAEQKFWEPQGDSPDVLVADRFLRIAREEWARGRVRVPFIVSDCDTLAQRGLLGSARRAENQMMAGPVFV